MSRKIEVKKGDVYNNLVIVGEIINSENKTNRFFICKCNCGKKFKTTLTHIRTGHTKSCGCLLAKILEKRNTKHGFLQKKDKISLKLYYAWQGMKKRCYNKNNSGYKHYGGRGIMVCERWVNSFENFKNDMFLAFKKHIKENGNKNTSLDRINNDGNYEPSNVRWTVRSIQNKNKRNTKYITWNGETMCVADWAKFFKIPPITLWQRLYKQKLGVEESFKRSSK